MKLKDIAPRILLVSALAVLFGASFGFASGRADVADAVMKGDQAAVRKLLQQNADVNAAQIDGATALHWAVYRDEVEVARLLIKVGAKLDATNREGVTALDMASTYGKPGMI